jgi:hypothetical protein
VLSVGSFAANGLILLSDRAPGLFGRVSSRIDAGVSRAANVTGVDVPGGNVRIPQSDFDVHVVIWAVATLLVGLAAWSWVSLYVVGGSVFLTSVAVELAQKVLTDSRTVQRQDVMANAVGVLCGLGAVSVFALIWSAVSTRRSAPGP